MIPIVAATQKYHWGKLGTSSLAGKYSRKTYPNTDEELFNHIHFAEIWMGTHPKAPSTVEISENIQQWLIPEYYEENKGKTVSLTSVIDANRETFLSKSDIFLTEDITTGHLPYLFKVL
jgi:mannose-6-phosphate isomerase class I